MSEWNVIHENFHTKHSVLTAPDEHRERDWWKRAEGGGEERPREGDHFSDIRVRPETGQREKVESERGWLSLQWDRYITYKTRNRGCERGKAIILMRYGSETGKWERRESERGVSLHFNKTRNRECEWGKDVILNAMRIGNREVREWGERVKRGYHLRGWDSTSNAVPSTNGDSTANAVPSTNGTQWIANAVPCTDGDPTTACHHHNTAITFFYRACRHHDTPLTFLPCLSSPWHLCNVFTVLVVT